jgi:hypothetical protein
MRLRKFTLGIVESPRALSLSEANYCIYLIHHDDDDDDTEKGHGTPAITTATLREAKGRSTAATVYSSAIVDAHISRRRSSDLENPQLLSQQRPCHLQGALRQGLPASRIGQSPQQTTLQVRR